MEKSGIKDTSKLYDKVITPADRKQLSKETGVSESEISVNIKDIISKETVFIKTIDYYKIYYTSKLNYSVEDLKKFEICAVGNPTPRKIIGDKIIWATSCGGVLDETSEKCQKVWKEFDRLYKLWKKI